MVTKLTQAASGHVDAEQEGRGGENVSSSTQTWRRGKGTGKKIKNKPKSLKMQ